MEKRLGEITNRKDLSFKIITTFVSFVLILALMSFGVWAAFAQHIYFETVLTFPANDVSAELVGNVFGDEQGEISWSLQTISPEDAVAGDGSDDNVGTGVVWLIPKLKFDFQTQSPIAIGFAIRNTGHNVVDISIDAPSTAVGNTAVSYRVYSGSQVGGLSILDITAEGGFHELAEVVAFGSGISAVLEGQGAVCYFEIIYTVSNWGVGISDTAISCVIALTGKAQP